MKTAEAASPPRASRRILAFIVGITTCAGFASCGAVCLASLGPSQRAIDNAESPAVIHPQQPGTLQVVHITGGPLWSRNIYVFLPTVEQTRQITAMDVSVHHPASAALRSADGAYVFWGYDTRWGRPLNYVPAGSTLHGAWWPVPAPPSWQGGFSNSSEVSYDYAGRSLSESRLTFFGYAPDVPNLNARHIELEGSDITVRLLSPTNRDRG